METALDRLYISLACFRCVTSLHSMPYVHTSSPHQLLVLRTSETKSTSPCFRKARTATYRFGLDYRGVNQLCFTPPWCQAPPSGEVRTLRRPRAQTNSPPAIGTTAASLRTITTTPTTRRAPRPPEPFSLRYPSASDTQMNDHCSGGGQTNNT
jgi:hypothetical protein